MAAPSLSRPVYLDHHATTPVDARVLEAMLPFFTERFGNAANRHYRHGWEANEAVETARQQVADLIGARAKEIIFTSGATEANNLAILGACRALSDRGRHVVTVATEHKAVLDTCRALEADGWRVTVLPVGRDGLVDVAVVADALTPETALVSVMAANNEIGVLQPIAEIGPLCRARGVVFHTDAVQAVGKVPFDVEAAQVDLASITAHKVYGPKGVGALYVRRGRPRVELEPLVHGGGQERGLRSGTLNVPGIVGFGVAAALAAQEREAEAVRVGALRDRLLTGLQRTLEGVQVNGSMTARLPHNLHVSFAWVDGEALITGVVEQVAVSSGSACASGSQEPSHVLQALGLGRDAAWGSIRFGLGRGTTEADVDLAVDVVSAAVRRLRALSPLAEGAASARA
jgi:cysteine desulfurase